MNKYNPETNLNYLDMIILSILMSVGIQEEEMQSITIDDAIFKIRETFEYTKSNIPTASSEIVRELSALLVLNLRRSWFDRQIAKEVLTHG